MYYIIVFESLRLRPSTLKRVASVFKNLHPEECFFNRCVFGDSLHRIRVDSRPNRFQTKTGSVDGALVELMFTS